MVAPTWDLMSSPMIGSPELLGPLRVGGDEHRQRVHEGHAGVDRALRVEPVGHLAAHRQVADQHVDPGLAERGDHVDRLLVRLGDRLAVEPAEAVVRRAALHGDAERRHVGDLDGVVLRGEDGLGEVASDLLGVHVERRDEAHVTHVIAAEVDMHEPGDPGRGIGVCVVLHSLHQRRGAVADADNGDSYLVGG